MLQELIAVAYFDWASTRKKKSFLTFDTWLAARDDRRVSDFRDVAVAGSSASWDGRLSGSVTELGDGRACKNISLIILTFIVNWNRSFDTKRRIICLLLRARKIKTWLALKSVFVVKTRYKETKEENIFCGSTKVFCSDRIHNGTHLDCMREENYLYKMNISQTWDINCALTNIFYHLTKKALGLCLIMSLIYSLLFKTDHISSHLFYKSLILKLGCHMQTRLNQQDKARDDLSIGFGSRCRKLFNIGEPLGLSESMYESFITKHVRKLKKIFH